jgi:hypothetical protein
MAVGAVGDEEGGGAASRRWGGRGDDEVLARAGIRGRPRIQSRLDEDCGRRGGGEGEGEEGEGDFVGR